MSEAGPIDRKAIAKMFDGNALLLGECVQTQLVIWLHEHEQPGPRIETWPQAIRSQMENAVAALVGRHGALRAVISGISTVDGHRACVLVLHHEIKK